MIDIKDVRIRWMGAIPSDWKCCRAKYLFQSGANGIKIGPFGSAMKGKTLEKGPFIIYNQAHLIQGDFSINRHFVSQETYSEMSGYSVEANDILFSMMGTIGKCRIVPYGARPGIIDSHLLKVRLGDAITPHFFEYVYDKDNSSIAIQQLLYYSNGTIMNGLNSTIVKNIYVPLPPINKQQRIVYYLVKKTAAVDALISDKKKLIALLKEKRQAIISEAVTKGLNKNAKMKDSGIKWIGAIPEIWDVKKIKHVFEIVKRLYFEEDRNVLSITQAGIKIRDLSSNDGQLAQSYAGYQLVHVNDFAMNSMDLLTGFVDCSRYEGVTSPDYRVFRFIVGQEMSCDYYKYMFQMCYANKIFYGYGQGVSIFGRWRLQTEVFKDFLIPVPPVEEQEAIVGFLNSQTAKLDSLISGIQTQIEKLKEYRQSVISEAVTGKVAI